MLKFKFLNRVLIFSCLSIHLAYSSAEVRDLRRLQDEIQTASQRISAFREAHADTNAVIVIGRTGRGKITLITHLAEKPLLAQAGVTGFTLYTETPLPEFCIGESVAVGTTVPNSWYDPTSNLGFSQQMRQNHCFMLF